MIVAALLSAPAVGPSVAGPTATCNGVPATIVGTARADELVGTPGDDVIVGHGRGDVIRGRGGNDLICGDGGNDTLHGGEGNDELRGGGSRIVRGDGQVLYYRDRLLPGPGDDVLVPGFDGGTHESNWDLLDFSGAPGGIVADVATDTITGHGTDTVIGDHYAIVGSRYDDTITGNDDEDEIYGLEGNDVLTGGSGEDRIDDDFHLLDATGAADDDIIDGGPGDDNLDSEAGNDEVLGGDGDDLIGVWSDVGVHLEAGAGNDTVYLNLALSNDQSYDAGPGRDDVLISGSYIADGRSVRPRTVIDLAAGTATVPGYDVSFPFSGSDYLTSYLPALTWYGTDGRDRVDGDPTSFGRTRRLIAYGRGGNDRVDGTVKGDLIDGGEGYDRADGEGGADECVAVEVQRSC